VLATITDANHSGSATGTLVIAKAAATIMLGGLAQTYDGTPKPASATTEPLGLTVDLNYDGSATAPTNAGEHAVVAIITDANHSGSATGTLVIAKAAATIMLGGLAQTYDGTPKPASATTDPLDLTVLLTYDGSTTAPSDPGEYLVVATVVDPNYQGTATATLSITAESLENWRTRCFTPDQIAAGQAADDADPDHDGLVNFAEYALGTHPLAFTPPLTAVRNDAGLVLTFQRPKGLPDVLYAAESSEDMIQWTPCTLEMVTDAPVQTMRAVDPLTSGNPLLRFIRLRFTTP